MTHGTFSTRKPEASRSRSKSSSDSRGAGFTTKSFFLENGICRVTSRVRAGAGAARDS